MGEEASSTDRPSWWTNLVPQRWRHQAPAPTPFGPASSYAERQVRDRLRSPGWNTEAPGAGDAAETGQRAPVNRAAFPAGGHVPANANRRAYPT